MNLAEEQEKKMKKLEKVLVGLVMLLGSPLAFAGLIVYDNAGDFVTDTAAVGVGSLPNNGGSAAFAVGGFTFSNVAGSSVNTTRNWSTLISENNDLAINGVENFDFTSPGSIYSFGFDFHEPSNTTPPGPASPDTCNTPVCVDSTFEVTLLLNAALVGTFSFNRADDLLQFVGVTSTEAFNRVQVRETVGTADNEFFGNFLVGRSPAQVPEPGTLGLIGAGLLSLAFRRRVVRG